MQTTMRARGGRPRDTLRRPCRGAAGRADALGEACVPQAQREVVAELAHKQTRHPAEGELHAGQAIGFLCDVAVDLGVDAVQRVFKGKHHALHARLRKRVMVLHRLHDSAKCPVRVRLDRLQ